MRGRDEHKKKRKTRVHNRRTGEKRRRVPPRIRGGEREVVRLGSERGYFVSSAAGVISQPAAATAAAVAAVAAGRQAGRRAR